MTIYADETVDDLQVGSLRLIQKKNGFKFGTDAVLLSDFAKALPSKRTLDLCTGSGIVPILLSAKTAAPEIHALEIQHDIADMARRSVELNGLEERIFVKEGNLCDGFSIYKKRSFDVITCNPPYMRAGAGILNKNDSKIISRHEVMCSLEDIISVSSGLLTLGGHLVMVHRPSRLSDIISLMRRYKTEPKRIRFVHKTAAAEPTLVLLDGLFGAKSDVRILPPLLLQNERGGESDELKAIYSRNS